MCARTAFSVRCARWSFPSRKRFRSFSSLGAPLRRAQGTSERGSRTWPMEHNMGLAWHTNLRLHRREALRCSPWSGRPKFWDVQILGVRGSFRSSRSGKRAMWGGVGRERVWGKHSGGIRTRENLQESGRRWAGMGLGGSKFKSAFKGLRLPRRRAPCRTPGALFREAAPHDHVGPEII